MIYSNTDILNAIETKDIVISSYNDDQLQTNSYDVCLGNTFYEVFWDSEGPFFVGPYIYLDGDKVEIPVGGTLLGVTKERVGTYGKVVAELRSKSSIRRIGIDPCMAAGWGDIGYYDVWCMEFTAFVREYKFRQLSLFDERIKPIPEKLDYSPFLIVGQPVAQMVFHECKSEPTKIYDGQYKVEWPLNMIPARYRHRIIAPKS
jgi:deoxycytidine triphosphate deaminase